MPEVTEETAREWLRAIENDWSGFQQAVSGLKLGDFEGFRAVNQTLGYNVAKAVPALVVGINDRIKTIGTLRSKLTAADRECQRLEKELIAALAANETLRKELIEITAIEVSSTESTK